MGRKKKNKKGPSNAKKKNDNTSEDTSKTTGSISLGQKSDGEPSLLGSANRDNYMERVPYNVKRKTGHTDSYHHDFPPLSGTQSSSNETGIVGIKAGSCEASVPSELESEKKIAHESNSLKRNEDHLEGAVGYNKWHLPNTKITLEEEKTGRESNAVNTYQIVSDIQARNVQVGNQNTMEMTSVEDVKKSHHTTIFGGDQSLNVFDGQATMHDVFIQNNGKTSCNGVSDVRRHLCIEQSTHGGNQVIKNINAGRVEIKTIVNTQGQGKSPEGTQLKSKHFESFTRGVQSFRDGHYILITDRTEHVQQIHAIGRAPWTAVFDFDVFSRRSGLLSHVEDILESRRCLNLYTWQDKCNITESSTSWVFMNGNDQAPDSVISASNPREWKRKTRNYLDNYVSQLAKFKMACTEFTVIVMWPQDSQNVLKINHLLTELDNELDPTVIIVDEGHQKTKVSESALECCLNMDGEISCVKLCFEEVCTIISGIFPEETQSTCFYKLPTYTRTNITDITDKQAKFIAEDLEVLYSDNMTCEELSSEELKQEEANFYRGGTLPWSWWYQVGPNHADIQRDIVPKIKDFILKEHIDMFKGGTITICHFPGSGGTTLAQRILWIFKDKVPCAQVKAYTGSSPESVMEKVLLLANKTNLPIILLMDGEEQQRVKLMVKTIKDHCCLILLYIKRCSQEIKNQVWKDNATFWLAGSISEKEATVLSLKYGNRDTDESKKKIVERMLSEIKEGRKHSLFEFGLELHRHCYYGLESYVKEFLQLQEKSELQPFQIALGMLSLVYYYGQATVPSHFFSGIFESEKDHKVLRYKDFPEQMYGLVMKDEQYGRRDGVRISHVLVAKEILDQLLVRKCRSPHKIPTISKDAKENLFPFAKSFIQYAGERSNGHSSLILKIVTKTFISRDNKPLGEDETYNSRARKSKISPILEDVSSIAPFTKRFEVLEQLTVSFPHESQFQAHLGRLYTIYKAEEHDKAESYFVKALDICREQTSGMKMEDTPHNMKLTLMHIYHMYGEMFSSWVSEYTGKYFEDKPKRNVVEGRFKSTACMLLEHTEQACKHFEQCREMTPTGYEQSYHYISEISIRLMLCNFILKHGGFKTLQSFMGYLDNDLELKVFLQESSEKLDELFIDCLSVVEPEQLDEHILSYKVWFSQLFKTERKLSMVLIERKFANREEDMHTRRMRIAIMKMNYNGEESGFLESVNTSTEIRYIIQQYENNFSDDNQILTKRQNDIDYREWLFAIRHRRYGTERSLEEVLTFVQRWYDRQKTPYARFYLFILKSLIGFGDGKYLAGNSSVLYESQILKAEVTEYARFIAKPKYPREWLGHANANIRRLVPGRRFFGFVEYQDDENDYEVMIGTICPPNNKPSSGYIDLDLGTTSPLAIKVFFVPGRSDMKGGGNTYARVEFHLGFSMFHGYEAYNVKPLKSVKCKLCDSKIEYRSCDTQLHCNGESCQGIFRRSATPPNN